MLATRCVRPVSLSPPGRAASAPLVEVFADAAERDGSCGSLRGSWRLRKRGHRDDDRLSRRNLDRRFPWFVLRGGGTDEMGPRLDRPFDIPRLPIDRRPQIAYGDG